MPQKDFIISKEDSTKRLYSKIHHKLRVVLKCYTINEFKMLTEDTFSFRKKYRVKGIKLQDKKTLTGRYELIEIDDESVLLKLFVD